MTFDYCYVRYDEEARECLCGHPLCVKTLGTGRGSDKNIAAGGNRGRARNGSDCDARQASSVARGGGFKATYKWQDPETGERVRPWLNVDDAEVWRWLIVGDDHSLLRL